MAQMSLLHYIYLGAMFTFLGVRVYWEIVIRIQQYQRGISSVESKGDTMNFVVLIYIVCFVFGFMDFQQQVGPQYDFPPIVQGFGILCNYLSSLLLHEVHAHLAHNWTPTIQKLSEHELVTSGPYRYVRHPMYSAILLFCASSFLCSGNRGFLLGFISMLCLSMFRIPSEEKLLRQMFGEKHEKYSKMSWKLIPFVW